MDSTAARVTPISEKSYVSEHVTPGRGCCMSPANPAPSSPAPNKMPTFESTGVQNWIDDDS